MRKEDSVEEDEILESYSRGVIFRIDEYRIIFGELMPVPRLDSFSDPVNQTFDGLIVKGKWDPNNRYNRPESLREEFPEESLSPVEVRFSVPFNMRREISGSVFISNKSYDDKRGLNADIIVSEQKFDRLQRFLRQNRHDLTYASLGWSFRTIKSMRSLSDDERYDMCRQSFVSAMDSEYYAPLSTYNIHTRWIDTPFNYWH